MMKNRQPKLQRRIHGGHFHVMEKRSRRERYLNEAEVQVDLGLRCKCGEQCMSKMDLDTALMWRTRLHQHTEGSRKNIKIIELMQSMTASPQYTKFIVNGEIICRHAWLLVLKISVKSFYRAWDLIKGGMINDPCTLGKNGKGHKGLIAVGYMDSYVKKMGDTCPESGRTYMPCCSSVGDIYAEYVTCHPDDHISKNQFYKLWRQNCTHVTFPKVTKMTKCNFCILAKEAIAKAAEMITRNNLKKERDEHLKRSWQEKKLYYERRADAKSDPQAKLSLILDGMDQAKTYLPHFRGWSAPKDCDKYRLQPHIEGCLVHGRTFHAFVSLEDGHDCNMVLHCLLDVLCRESNADGLLPPTLYIQLDNCYRENKNRFFIGFMGYLIARHILDEIHMYFLMVGHTHEDIDQRFSCVSRALKHASAKTLPELLQVVKDSMPNQKVEVSRQGTVYDIRSWIEPYLNPISLHSGQHAFRFTRSESGHVLLSYKQWSQDMDWQPNGYEDPIPVFISDGAGKMKLPPGSPSIRNPTYQRQNLEMVKRTISSASHHLLDNSHKEWWNSFLENPLTGMPSNEWQMMKLKKQPSSVQLENKDAIEAPIEGTLLTPFLEKERRSAKIVSKNTRAARGDSLVSGKMVLTKSKEVGVIVEVCEAQVTLSLFHGKKNSVWKPFLRPNGRQRSKVVTKVDILRIFDLTHGLRLPGLIAKYL